MTSRLYDKLTRVRVESIREIASDVFVLEFKRFFEFEAGQVISIALDGEVEPRMYSIASGEQDENIQVLFNVVNEGHLTPALSGLSVGDSLWTSQGFGKFKGVKGDAWWIAQGTGIAPFASMLRSGLAAHKTLIHGGRHQDSFYFAKEFEALLKDNYVKCSSRFPFPGAFQGRVTDYLKSLTSLPQDPMYYLCGSSEMVVETRDILIKRGVPFKNIVGEIYF